MQFPRLTWISTTLRNPRRPGRLFQYATWETPHRLDGRMSSSRVKGTWHLSTDRRPSSISGKGSQEDRGTRAKLYYQELCRKSRDFEEVYKSREESIEIFFKKSLGTSLVIQRLRLKLSMQGPRFQPGQGIRSHMPPPTIHVTQWRLKPACHNWDQPQRINKFQKRKSLISLPVHTCGISQSN